MEILAQRLIVFGNRILAELRRISESLKQDKETVQAEQERDGQKDQVRPIWLEEVFAKHDQTEGNRSANDDRNYRVQNSLRWATWAAFIAASIYGAIAACQLYAIRESNKTAQKQLVASVKSLRFFY